MNILINKVTLKVTIKSQEICLFCDFIVTNILVTHMIISNYRVTLNYILEPVLLSQIAQPATPVPERIKRM